MDWQNDKLTEDDMTDLVYRGVRYEKESLTREQHGEIPTLRYRGAEYDPRDAWKMARPVFSRSPKRVYRGVSDQNDGPGGTAIAAV